MSRPSFGLTLSNRAVVLGVVKASDLIELERKSYAWLRSTHDYEEGVRSFVEKREPKYEGR